uniref:Ribosomal protein L30e (RP-L30e, RPL30) n=1 Tax=uncultured marine group II/III euryarchaeote KM3_139_C07 TaxID=1457870 RepID=A0A075G9T9_9EURY|nr:ribosomal protein L30e (RP-L30e, RPL30) [uncultured marine group II/III euryarchaeote KM3_139_C07]
MKDPIKEIKQLLKTKKLVFGTEQTIKNLKQNKLEKFFISSNCNQETKEDLQHYSKISKIEATPLQNSNKDIGILCKKPFSISVLGVLK